VVDKLPKNLIEHVRKSNNPALEAALKTTVKSRQNVKSSGQSKPRTEKLIVKPPTMLRHAARSRQKVEQSLPGSSDDPNSSSTDISSSIRQRN
jgi:hypothetical protein